MMDNTTFYGSSKWTFGDCEGVGASIDKAGIGETTPLFSTAYKENLEIVKVLLDIGAEVIIVNLYINYIYITPCSVFSEICVFSLANAFCTGFT
jgi:hypothetical protein